MFRYHPEIEGLKVNEDGTEIIYFGEELKARGFDRKEREADTLVVHFLGRTHSVGKLICECWHGMRENSGQCATRKDKKKGFHYTNLYWAKCGTNPAAALGEVKRSKLSKIRKEDIPAIEKRLRKGESLNSIAADYNTSEMSISRLKKKLTCNNDTPTHGKRFFLCRRARKYPV